MNRIGKLWKGTISSHRRVVGGSSQRSRRSFHYSHASYASSSTTSSSSASNSNSTTSSSSTSSFKKMQELVDDEAIVISGISGRFPQTDSIEEFKQNLFSGVDMVTEQDRFHMPNVPKRYGFLKTIDKFDANFFGIVPKLAECMDPQQRKLLEVTFEAIVDSGSNPQALKGSRTGVYVGTLGGESMDYYVASGGQEDLEGYGAMGIPNFMSANRLSYTFDFKGPSTIMSTGCSASLIALEAAVQAIRSGNCDAAIVAGATVHLNPGASMDLMHLNALSPDGKCKAFDESANGFVRSEGVVAMLIQKKKAANRVYATIRHIKSNSDGYKNEGLVFPSGQSQETLLREIYEEAGIDPGAVSYFEAHGTGTPAGDPQELQAISNVFCKAPSRKEPLLIGSVKSNMGHAESAAALCSIAKVVIGIQGGVLPGNLHFNEPNSYVKHVFDDSLKVVTEATPWNGKYVGISAFGLGGTNSHLILEAGPKYEENATTTTTTTGSTTETSGSSEIPILVPFSGRTEETVEASIKEAAAIAGKNPEFTRLLHSVFEKNIPGHGYRGYGIIKPGETEIEQTNSQVKACDQAGNRPVWIIFPGMGSQWNEMGKDLMKLDAFAESIRNSKTTLKNAGVDLDALLKPKNPTIFSNIRDSLVSITAVQVALYDTLMSMGLKPDGFVGHSSGEILCAYADGCLTAEEALLVGDARGRAFHETSDSPGGMAAVGLSWEQVKAKVPANIIPACHNAETNVSISGPLEEIRSYIKVLQSEGIFAKEINSCNCAPHSKYVYPAMDRLFTYMHQIYQDDRPRTSRWISSSIPEEDWDTLLAQTSSPAYHVNNMGSPVLFHEALQHVPENAVVVEIAPHGLFQAILKGTLSSPSTVHVAPMHAVVPDKLSYFLGSVGKIYNAGVDLDLSALYPHVKLPVSASTPNISSLIKWDHEKSWKTAICSDYGLLGSATTVKVNVADKSHKYLHGHKLDSRTVYPATGYLVLAWERYARSMGVEPVNLPVTFENVTFERATFLSDEKPTEFGFSVFKETGAFEIVEDGAVVVRGNIQSPESSSKKMLDLEPATIPEDAATSVSSLNTEDVYKELKLRGYNYSGDFRGIKRIDSQGEWAQVKWNGNWVSFLDTVLQTVALSVMSRNTAVPVRLQSVTVDPTKLQEFVASKNADEELLVPVSVHKDLNCIQCPGVEMRGLTAMVIPRKRQDEMLSVEEYNFTPYFDTNVPSSPPTAGRQVAGLVDLVLENVEGSKLKIADIFTKAENALTESIYQSMTAKPRYQSEITMLTLSSEVAGLEDKVKNLGQVVSKDSAEKLIPDAETDLVFVDDAALLSSLAASLKNGAYIALRSQNKTDNFPQDLLKISEKFSENSLFSLFKKKSLGDSAQISSVSIDSPNFDWLPKLQELMGQVATGESPESSRIYLTSQNDPESGLVGLVKCLRMEPGGESIRAIMDPHGALNLDFAKPDATLSAILENDLVMNIFKTKDNVLGSYRHFPLAQDVSVPSKQAEHAYINTLTTGDLTSLRWIESALKYYDPSQATVGPSGTLPGKLCRVNYASMNFRDIMLATGKLPIDSATSYSDCVMGFEFTGTDECGARVMGMLPSKGLATSVLADPEFVWKVPDRWTLEEAATVPIVYATAYYALFNRAHLRPGQSILIHSGTGGVGQAAINLALHNNCEVFTTVGTEEKRKYIKELFPSLKDENIGNSRDCSFEPQIMKLTKGKGVNIVLNSLADDKLQASVRCLGLHGKFLEIGAFDAFQNTPLGMGCFLKNIDFHGIFLNQIFTKSEEEKQLLKRNLTEGIESGVVKPLPRTVFAADQIEDAFRFMAGGKHMGKVLIKVQEEKDIGKPPAVPAIPRTYFHADKSYVIVGGLGGLGLEVANWMVDRGARNLVLVSRSGVTTGYQALCMRKWAEKGVTVATPQIDLSSDETAEKFVKDLAAKGKVGGIFNSGLVLKDAGIENQTVEMFQQVAAPKVQVTKSLDRLSRQYCPDLDYFVVFSSGACGRGNPGQSNYGLANSVMEQICEERREEGLHGLAIQWGIIGEVGFVAEKLMAPGASGTESFDGTVAQRIASCLDVLDLALNQTSPVYSSMVLADKTRKSANKRGLLETLSTVFGIKDVSKINPATKLVDLGMDSLIGMELKQALERDFDLPLTPNEIRGMTMGDLIAIDAGTFVKGSPSSTSASATTSATSKQAASSGTQSSSMRSAAETIVKLNSGEIDDDIPPVFLVHGIEGHPGPLKKLSKKMKLDVYAFQISDDNPIESIPQMAAHYIEEMKLVQPEGPYNLAGYSSGGSVMFEMARQLEQEHKDEVLNLMFLDGSCNWQGKEDFSVKDKFVYAFQSTFGHKLPAEQSQEMASHFTEDLERNTKLVKKLLKLLYPDASEEQIQQYFGRYVTFSQLTFEYRTDYKYSGRTTLVKASERSEFLEAVMDDNFNLSNYCDGPLSIFEVEGDHRSFLNVDQTASILNDVTVTNTQEKVAATSS